MRNNRALRQLAPITIVSACVRTFMAASDARVENCPLCDSFAATNVKGVVRHIGLVHSHEPGFRITCGVGGCMRTYTKFNSYKKHMYVKHGELLRVTAARECSHEEDVLDFGSQFNEYAEEPS